MHFVLSYDVQDPNISNQDQIEMEITQALEPYSWVKPLRNTYVIQVPSQMEWSFINQSLSKIGSGNGQVNFIMSPLMHGGKYEGLLTENLWEAINERSL